MCRVIKFYIAEPFLLLFCQWLHCVHVFLFLCAWQASCFILKHSQVWICPSCFSLSVFQVAFLLRCVSSCLHRWSQAIQSHLHRLELRVRYTLLFSGRIPTILEDSLTQLAKFKGGEFACILARCWQVLFAEAWKWHSLRTLLMCFGVETAACAKASKKKW